MGTIRKDAGLFTLSFADGSILKNCQRRTSVHDGKPIYSWFVFHGRQFQLKELRRWGAIVKIQQEGCMQGIQSGDKIIKIWRVNDCEWWAGTDLDSIKAKYKEVTGIDPAHPSDGFDEPDELSEAELDKLRYHDPELDIRHSFRTQLQKMVDSGEEFPNMFASTEY